MIDEDVSLFRATHSWSAETFSYWKSWGRSSETSCPASDPQINPVKVKHTGGVGGVFSVEVTAEQWDWQDL